MRVRSGARTADCDPTPLGGGNIADKALGAPAVLQSRVPSSYTCQARARAGAFPQAASAAPPVAGERARGLHERSAGLSGTFLTTEPSSVTFSTVFQSNSSAVTSSSASAATPSGRCPSAKPSADATARTACRAAHCADLAGFSEHAVRGGELQRLGDSAQAQAIAAV